MDTFANTATINTLTISEKLIASLISMMIGFSLTLVTLVIIYIAMKLLAGVSAQILKINDQGGLGNLLLNKNKIEQKNKKLDLSTGNTQENNDISRTDAVAISAAISAYYMSKNNGTRIVIRDIRRGTLRNHR